MNICIPTILTTKKRVGVTSYLIALISELQIIDKRNKYYIITTTDNFHFFNIKNPNFHEIRITLKEYNRIQHRIFYLIWHHYFLPRLLKKYNIDILHVPCPWFINSQFTTIVTIHDLIEVNTKKYNRLLNFSKRKMIFSSIYNSDYIISISNSTTNEILKYRTGVITTISNGNNGLIKFSTEELQFVMRKFSLQEKKYFVFIGTLQHHKNLINLIDAFSIFHKSYPEYKLVLVGKKDNVWKQVQTNMRRNGLSEHIVITNHVSEIEKVSILSKAVCLCLISFEEGFGFPILEAQSLGIPVIVSDIPALRETAGLGAQIVDPHDIIDISEKMDSILSETNLSEKLVELGRKNLYRFSWQLAAKETLKVYEKVFDANN